MIQILLFWHGYKVEIFSTNSWKCVVRLNFFTKTCLTKNYISCDPHLVILAWVQSWNISEKLMKLWSPPEFIHKNMSHEQLPFMWSTLRDTRVFQKYFNFVPMLESRNKDHVKSNCSWDMFLWKNSGGLHIFICFSKIINFISMLESRNVDHLKSNCSWDMFLWKNDSGLHTFISFSKIFQLCTHARIT